VNLHDPSNRAGRQADNELDQLALDRAMAPSGILPGQAYHEGRRVLVQPGAWSVVRVSPAPGHETAVPGEEFCRCHAERAPPGAEGRAAECGQQSPVSWLVGRTSDLASEYGDLVAQDPVAPRGWVLLNAADPERVALGPRVRDPLHISGRPSVSPTAPTLSAGAEGATDRDPERPSWRHFGRPFNHSGPSPSDAVCAACAGGQKSGLYVSHDPGPWSEWARSSAGKRLLL